MYMYKMSCVTRTPVYGVSDEVGHKLGCTTIEYGQRLELSRDCTIYEAKTKALMQLICTYVFAYTISRFSHDVAQKEGCLDP